MKNCLIQAQYHGHSDSYFVGGNIYNLVVTQGWFGRLIITPTHGFDYKPYHDMHEVYGNLAEFLKHWRVEKLISDQAGRIYYRAEGHHDF